MNIRQSRYRSEYRINDTKDQLKSLHSFRSYLKHSFNTKEDRWAELTVYLNIGLNLAAGPEIARLFFDEPIITMQDLLH